MLLVDVPVRVLAVSAPVVIDGWEIAADEAFARTPLQPERAKLVVRIQADGSLEFAGSHGVVPAAVLAELLARHANEAQRAVAEVSS